MNAELLEVAIWTVTIDRHHIELDERTTSAEELHRLTAAIAQVYEELAEDAPAN